MADENMSNIKRGKMIVHLNLHASENFPIKLYEKTKKNQDIKIKVTNRDSPARVKILSHDSFSCEKQQEHGHLFFADQYLTFELNVESMESLQFCNVEIYVLEECIGRAYLSDCYFINGHGSFIIPLLNPSTSEKSAEIKFDYMIIKRWRDRKLTDNPCRSIPHCKEPFIYLGHRGCGSTRDRTEAYLENTIQSFCAAHSLGASFVECDVTLTKDLVPIVYHDHDVSIFVEKKDGSSGIHSLHVHDMTLEEVSSYKMDFARPGAGTDYNDNTFSHLCPTLEEVINETPTSLGLLLEIKYPMQEQESKIWETENYHDRNVIADRVLDILDNCDQQKPIGFCSFDPDICILLNCKQDRYPVLYITHAENTTWPAYMDIRSRTRRFGVNFGLMNDLMGVSMYGNPLLNDPEEFLCIVSTLRKNGKHLFTWGSCNESQNYVLYQKSIGVAGCISDRLENLSIGEIGA